MNIVEYRKGAEKQYSEDLKYWSNSCGELHHHGQYDIKESELPKELSQAYNELWSDGMGPLCYLAEYKGQYGIALISEFDNDYAENTGSTMGTLYRHMQAKAKEFSVMEHFTEAQILLAEEMGCDNCHEFVVFLFYSTPKEEFTAIADTLNKNLYK